MNPKIKIILACLLFGLSGVFIKLSHLPATQIGLFRYVVPTLLFLIFSRRLEILNGNGNKKLLLLASSLNCCQVFFYMFGMTKVAVSLGNLIITLSPILIMLFSVIFLKDQLTARKAYCFALGFAGLLLIYFSRGIEFGGATFSGITALVFSSTIVATVAIIMKHQSAHCNGFELAFYQNIVGSIVFGILALFYPAPSPSQAIWASLYGIAAGFLGFSLYFSAIKTLPLTIVVPLSYIEILSAVCYGVILFGERLPAIAIVGGVLIILGSYLSRENADNVQQTASE